MTIGSCRDSPPIRRLVAVAVRAWVGPLSAWVLVFAIAWLALELGHGSPPLHGDSHEDLLLARACLEQGRCPTIGARTSWPGIYQGALWVNLLAVWRSMPLSVETIHSLTLAMAALGVALVFAVLRQRDLGVALGFAVTATLALLVGGTLRPLWNPSLMPLPASLLFALCLRATEEVRWRSAPCLGFALALTLEGHPVAVLVAPGTLVAASLCAARPLGAVVAPFVSLTVALGMHAWMSPAAAERNLTTMLGTSGPLTTATALGALVAVGTWLRPRFQSRPVFARQLWVAGALAVPTLLGLLYKVWEGGPLGARYVGAVVPPVAFLLAVTATKLLGKRLTEVVLVALALAAVAYTRRLAPELSLPTLEAVVGQWTREGISLDEVLARSSGPRCREIAAAAAAVGMPRASQAPHGLPAEDLVLVDVADSGLRGRRHGVTGVSIVRVRPWLLRRRFSACVALEGGPVCVERNLESGIEALMGSDPQMFQRLSEPSLHWTDEELEHAPAATVRYRFGLRVPPRSGQRQITLPRGLRDCPARFVELSGIDGVIGPERLVLRSSNRWQQGQVVVSVDPHGCGGASLEIFPPCILERSVPGARPPPAQ